MKATKKNPAYMLCRCDVNVEGSVRSEHNFGIVSKEKVKVLFFGKNVLPIY